MADISIINLLLGMVLAVIAGILFALGIILQKKAVIEMDDIKLTDTESIKTMVKNKTWLIGIGLALLGGVPYIAIQVLVGVALTQPLTLGLQLAFTVIFGIKLLGEKLETLEIIGFIVLLISPVFLALGSVTPPDVNVTESSFFVNFAIFLIPFIIICVAVFVLIKAFKKNESIIGLLAAFISGILFAVGAVTNQVGVEFIRTSLDFTFIMIAIVFFVMMMLGNTLATGVQNIAFQKGKVGIAIGIQSCANLLLAVFGGMIIFNQQILYPVYFILGIALIFLGNILLIRFQARLEEIDLAQESIEKDAQ